MFLKLNLSNLPYSRPIKPSFYHCVALQEPIKWQERYSTITLSKKTFYHAYTHYEDISPNGARVIIKKISRQPFQ